MMDLKVDDGRRDHAHNNKVKFPFLVRSWWKFGIHKIRAKI